MGWMWAMTPIPRGAMIVRGGPTGDVLAYDPDPRICALDYMETRHA